MNRRLAAHAFVLSLSMPPLPAAPVLLDDRFELPSGFHIYRAAQPDLTGGSYDLTFDGEGRLLVGDGQNIRRLEDTDGDGVYDAQEIIATGLGGRGPQGLLVIDDLVYAVGGDGVQWYSGYLSGGSLTHEGRIGEKFNTGGDHAAHTLLRGLDGWIYLVSGDGGGVGGRKHITEESSPCINERDASVFRFSPDGRKWECIASGGRNPPSLGMNYLGEFFSFDSDMEWHVDLPFYRPVRLNHWPTGADLGWQGVGAYPPYYIDTIPGILDVGRGSPDWGVFYEHKQFPVKYRDAFICCDYRWKSATSGGYNKSGRLVTFGLKRAGATWAAEMWVLAEARPGAKDENGKTINFGLVDVDVAPDGSIMVSDHNQGVWRIFYDEDSPPAVPPIVPEDRKPKRTYFKQPQSEWSRRRAHWTEGDLERAVRDPALTMRLRAHLLGLLAPDFENLDPRLLDELAGAVYPELRGQVAWLRGIRAKPEEVPKLIEMLEDEDPFVRRRACEAFTRIADARANEALIARTTDPDRHVRYAAMTALAKRPGGQFLAETSAHGSPHANMRGLVAANIRGERPPAEVVNAVVGRLLNWTPTDHADQLDRLRIFGLFHKEIAGDPATRKAVADHLLEGLPAADRDLRWEHVRLLGQYDVAEAFAPMLKLLEFETDGTTQFHIANGLAGISSGWTSEESVRLAKWLVSTQTGWFAELDGKGRQFGGFWATTLNQLAERHASGLSEVIDDMVPGSQLAKIAFKGIADRPDAGKRVVRYYREANSRKVRLQLLEAMATMSRNSIGKFLVEELEKDGIDAGLREGLLRALASQPLSSEEIGRLYLPAILESDHSAEIETALQRLRSEGKPVSAYGNAVAKASIGDRRGEQALYFRLLELLSRQQESAGTVEGALATLAGRERSGSSQTPEVIWSSEEQEEGDAAWFAHTFELPGDPSAGKLRITCDNEFIAFLNGKKIAESRTWEKPVRIDVAKGLKKGKNLITVYGVNHGGPAGLMAILQWKTDDGKTGMVSTRSGWRMTRKPPIDWHALGASVGNWRSAVDVSDPTKNVLDVMGAQAEADTDAEWIAAQEDWQNWYREKFGEAFVARPAQKSKLLADETIHDIITKTRDFAAVGDPKRGRQVYLNAGCFACHGGLQMKGATLFGPSLPGVTLRLNRQELADAIVYPSRQVAERFKATVIETADGKTLSGFVTENTDDFVSVTDLQNNVTRLPRPNVKSIQSQDTSLMQPRLLSAFSENDVRDLMAFLATMK